MLQGPEALLTALDGSGLLVALGAALLLGLRHATDPDHLTAISTLVVGEPGQGARRAARLGLAWGTGHALTLLILGIPVVLFQRFLPGSAAPMAEGLVGLVIIALAVRLLLRWRRGYFHAHQHQHQHDGGTHVHLHAHNHPSGAHAAARHAHRHGTPGRGGREAFGVGLLHGAGGSGAAGAMLVGATAGPGRAALALLLFAAGTAISMGLVSSGVGLLFGGPARARAFQRLIPLVGLGGLGFGAWYAAEALRAMSVPFGAS